MTHQRVTRVVLAAAHIDHDPSNNRMRNLASLCQRCHLLHDRAWHLLQRWITYRRRYASADLFIGPYRHGRDAAATLTEIAMRIAERRSTRGKRGREDLWTASQCPPPLSKPASIESDVNRLAVD
jgi:hypothetical protein